MSEADFGRRVKRLFSRRHEIYNEVVIGRRAADMVCVGKDGITIVELKTRVSFKAITQASFWARRYAHRVYLAVEKKIGAESYPAVVAALGYYGIGLVATDHIAAPAERCEQPGLIYHTIECLDELQKRSEAGTADGSRLSQRERADRRLLAALSPEWQPLADLVRRIQHGYASHKTAIKRYAARRKKIPGAIFRFRRGRWEVMERVETEPREVTEVFG